MVKRVGINGRVARVVCKQDPDEARGVVASREEGSSWRRSDDQKGGGVVDKRECE